MEAVSHMGSRSFDNQVMVFEALKPRDQISELKLVLMDFWVHILDLLFGWATTTVGEALGRSLREVKGVFFVGNKLQVHVA